MSLDKAQGPIYYFGPLPLQYIYIYITFFLRMKTSNFINQLANFSDKQLMCVIGHILSILKN